MSNSKPNFDDPAMLALLAEAGAEAPAADTELAPPTNLAARYRQTRGAADTARHAADAAQRKVDYASALHAQHAAHQAHELHQHRTAQDLWLQQQHLAHQRAEAHAHFAERDRHLAHATALLPARLLATRQRTAADRAEALRTLLEAQALDLHREQLHHFFADRAKFHLVNPHATEDDWDAHDAALATRYPHALAAPEAHGIATTAHANLTQRAAAQRTALERHAAAQIIAAAQQWLAANPDHEHAPTLRAKLEAR